MASWPAASALTGCTLLAAVRWLRCNCHAPELRWCCVGAPPVCTSLGVDRAEAAGGPESPGGFAVDIAG
jgi:hypothetical protein